MRWTLLIVKGILTLGLRTLVQRSDNSCHQHPRIMLPGSLRLTSCTLVTDKGLAESFIETFFRQSREKYGVEEEKE